MNRMPCSITDGPQWDDDEIFPPPPNPDDEHDKQIEMYDKQFALNVGLGPLLQEH